MVKSPLEWTDELAGKRIGVLEKLTQIAARLPIRCRQYRDRGRVQRDQRPVTERVVVGLGEQAGPRDRLDAAERRAGEHQSSASSAADKRQDGAMRDILGMGPKK